MSREVARRVKVEEKEEKIVKETVTVLLLAGFQLTVDQGGEGEAHKPTTNVKAIYDDVMECDDDYLFAYKPGESEPFGWVRFVYGNDGNDVISDYTTNLEDVLAAVNVYADTL
jgi:hypothetical protein